MLSKGTEEVLEQVLESESRCSDDGENNSDDDSVFHPSDVSDDDDDDDDNDDDDDDDGDDANDILWEAEAKHNTGSKIFIIILNHISSCIYR